eukprot:49887_1
MRHSPSTATPYKVNVGVGAYRSTDDAGLSYVTSSPAFVRRKFLRRTPCFAIRKFIDDGHLLATVHSFSKNSGLYGQRVGALSIVCQDPNEAKKVLSQMKMTIRPMCCNPPRQGEQLVETTLEDDRLTADFIYQCSVMADRMINAMRVKVWSTLDLGGGWWKW